MCGRGSHDRPGHGMLAIGLGGGQGQQLALGNAVGSHDVGDGVCAFGQGAGLIKQDHVDGAHVLQGQPVLDEHPGFRGPLGGDRDDQGDGQAQGVRTGDDQHGHRADHGIIGAADDGPDHGGDQGEPEQEGCGSIGQGLGPGGGGLGIGDHALDACQGGVPTGGLHPDPDGVVGGHGAGHHGFTGIPEDGAGFTGDHGLIEFGRSVDDGPVGRDAGTGSDQHDIVDGQL